MVEHEHEIGGCGCGQDHDATATQESSQVADVASQSLSNALRLSFRILSVVMVVVVAAFLATSVRCTSANKVAVTKVMGKVTGHSDRSGGLVFTWPYPIGDVQMVTTGPQKLEVNVFWRYETGADLAANLQDRIANASESLRPGLDGALFTGDQNLLHAQFTCIYQIENAEGYLKRFSDKTRRIKENEADPVLEQVIRSAICKAAIHLAAVQTADSIFRAREDFIARLRTKAQAELERLLPVEDGQSRVVTLANFSGKVDWPLRAKGASGALQNASTGYDGMIKEAEKEATRRLQETAGNEYKKLVGQPWNPQRPKIGSDDNLIGQYSDVREHLSRARIALHDAGKKGDTAAQAQQKKLIARHNSDAETILARIDKLLSENSVQGKVSEIMTKAQQDKANFIADVRKRENAFRSDLEVFKVSPELLLNNRWAEVRDQILQSDLVGKIYLTLGNGKTTVYINLDPNITKALNTALLKAGTNKDQGQGTGPK